jgi:hypothetical protein
MVAGLSVLARLDIVDIGSESPRSFPDRKTRRPPPLTRILLHARVGEYLEDVVVRIDASLLKKLGITLFYMFYQLIFDIP